MCLRQHRNKKQKQTCINTHNKHAHAHIHTLTHTHIHTYPCFIALALWRATDGDYDARSRACISRFAMELNVSKTAVRRHEAVVATALEAAMHEGCDDDEGVGGVCCVLVPFSCNTCFARCFG